jgi:hypothetical protein
MYFDTSRRKRAVLLALLQRNKRGTQKGGGGERGEQYVLLTDQNQTPKLSRCPTAACSDLSA